MTSIIPAALMASVALFFLWLGAFGLFRPAHVLKGFGVRSLTPDMRNEIRAVYGGFGVAVGALLVAAIYIQPLRAGVLCTVAVALLGMAAGRLYSFAVEPTAGRLPRVFVLVELILAGFLMTAVWLDTP